MLYIVCCCCCCCQVWCPSRRDARGSWLQVDLGLPYYICSVAVKGNTGDKNEWVNTYFLALSSDGTVFHHVKENSVIKVNATNKAGHTLQQSHATAAISFIPYLLYQDIWSEVINFCAPDWMELFKCCKECFSHVDTMQLIACKVARADHYSMQCCVQQVSGIQSRCNRPITQLVV